MIIPLKKDYIDPEKQDDINHDSLMLMAMNISAKHRLIKNRKMNKKEVVHCVEMFIEFMNNENELNLKWGNK